MTYIDDPAVGRNVARFVGVTLRETGDWQHGEIAVVAEAALGKHLCGPGGALRSGALLTLCDNVGGFCGGLAALPDGWVVSTNLMMRAASLKVVGPLSFESTVLRKGKNAIVASVAVTDKGADYGFVASATLTSAVLVPESGPPRWERPAVMIHANDDDGELPDFYEWLGLRFHTRDNAVSLDVGEHLRNPWGIVHGGVTASLVDAAAVAAAAHENHAPNLATHDAVVHYLAPSRIGPMRATGEVLAQRPDGTVVRVEVRDEGADRVTATAVTTVR